MRGEGSVAPGNSTGKSTGDSTVPAYTKRSITMKGATLASDTRTTSGGAGFDPEPSPGLDPEPSPSPPLLPLLPPLPKLA